MWLVDCRLWTQLGWHYLLSLFMYSQGLFLSPCGFSMESLQQGSQNYSSEPSRAQKPGLVTVMRKPRTGRIHSRPNTASREETIQVVWSHQNVIEYHTLLGPNCTLSPPHPLLSLYFSIYCYLPHLSGSDSKLLLWLHPWHFPLISYWK